MFFEDLKNTKVLIIGDLAMDESYINNRSLLGDIVILWKTIGVVALKKGAY